MQWKVVSQRLRPPKEGSRYRGSALVEINGVQIWYSIVEIDKGRLVVFPPSWKGADGSWHRSVLFQGSFQIEQEIAKAISQRTK